MDEGIILFFGQVLMYFGENEWQRKSALKLHKFITGRITVEALCYICGNNKNIQTCSCAVCIFWHGENELKVKYHWSNVGDRHCNDMESGNM